MACLVHDPHYRSLFHAVVNELRNENRVPVPILRNMPNKCCTCKDIDKLMLMSVLMYDTYTLKNLQKLINQIDRDKKTNPLLVLSLNRLENFIKENRGPAPKIPESDIDMRESRHSDFESEDGTRMDTGKRKSKREKKPPKPLKSGTFLFLPYKFEEQPKSGLPLETAKKLQRGRFLGRNKYIASIEEQHNVCINMITAKTSEQIKHTLNNAKAGIGNVKIHNQEDLTDKEDGEWILVREKKKEDQINTTDFEVLLNELKNRWDSFLKVRKRKREEDHNKHRNKK